MLEYFRNSEVYKSFEKLSKEEQFVLYVFAYFNNTHHYFLWDKVCNITGYNKQQCANARQILRKRNWLTYNDLQYDYYHEHINVDAYFCIAFSLLEEQVPLYEKFTILKELDCSSLWKMTLLLAENDEQKYIKSSVKGLQSETMGFFFTPFLEHEAFFSFFQALSPNNFFVFASYWLSNKLVEYSSPQDFEKVEKITRDYSAKHQLNLSDSPLGMVRFYKFVIHGIKENWSQLGATVYDYCLLGLLSLIDKNYAQALSDFSKALSIHNSYHSYAADKGFFNKPILDFLLMISYFKNESPAIRKKLKAFVKKIENRSFYPPILAIAENFVNGNLSNRTSSFLATFVESETRDFTKALGSIACNILNIKPGKKTDPKQLYNPSGIALLRNEQRSFLSVQDDQFLQQQFGDPLTSDLGFKEEWLIAYENAIAINDKMEKNAGKPSPTRSSKARLIYIFSDYSRIGILEQKMLRKGGWSTGTRLSLPKFVRCESDAMDETDNQIAHFLASHLDDYVPYDPSHICPYLIGSDRVFYEKNGVLEPVKITDEACYVIIDRNDNSGFSIRTNIPLINISVGKITNHVVVKESNTHYTVYTTDAEKLSLINAVCAIQKIPKKAEAQLNELITKISDKIEIHSDLLIGGSTLQKVKSNSLIVIRFEQQFPRFFLAISVQPLDGGKSQFSPGKGKTTIFDEKDGKRFQIERNLQEEQENLEKLQKFAENEIGLYITDEQIEVSLFETLSILKFANDNPSVCCVEWPKGEKINIKAQLNTNNLNLKLKSSGNNWFEVEGNIQINENELLSVTDLLKLVSGEVIEKRFVRLNETDFIEINEQLCKSLIRLESLTQKYKGKTAVPFYHVGTLAEIVKDAEGNIATDKKLKELSDKIQRADGMEIKIPSALNAELRDYQIDGFKWMSRLAEWSAGGCLADDMGLGKTVQAISFFVRKASEGPIMVVAPVSVVKNWVNELQRFAPNLNPIVLNEVNERSEILSNLQAFDVLITSYGILVREEEQLSEKQWNIVCLDEAHIIKNRDTKMSSAAMKLNAIHRVILTGTPIQNNLSELWNLFQFLNPGLLGTFEHFTQRFINPITLRQDKECQRQLRRIISPFLLRRTKNQVLDELPEKEDIVRLVEMSHEETCAYEVMRSDAEKMLDESSSINVTTLAEITKLREAACSMSLVNKKWPGISSKVTEFISLATEIIEGGNRALVFSQFTSFFTQIKTEIDKQLGADCYFYLDGSTPLKKREDMVKRFQQGEKKLFLISLKAGGLGLNLTGANYVIHLDPWWNPAIEQQATDRAYRIGQRQNVTIYHLISEHTIEEKILRLHKKKRDLADALLADSNISRGLTLEDLKMLIQD